MYKIIFPLVLLMTGCMACSQKKNGNPAGYNLSSPEILKMPSELNEISGIAFHNGNPDTLYAEQDEEGKLFFFSPADMKVQHIQFGKPGDYEDVSIAGGKVFILKSDGHLLSFSLNNVIPGNAGAIREFPFLLPKGEYEGMYADEAENLLYVLCKGCGVDKKSGKVTGYVLKWNANLELVKQSEFAIDATEIAQKIDKEKINFRPSALAKNKKSNEWFILSSVNKLLVVTDLQWKVKQVFPLENKLFYQPEGIAFDKAGNLYISNERGDFDNANLLKFLYNAANK